MRSASRLSSDELPSEPPASCADWAWCRVQSATTCRRTRRRSPARCGRAAPQSPRPRRRPSTPPRRRRPAVGGRTLGLRLRDVLHQLRARQLAEVGLLPKRHRVALRAHRQLAERERHRLQVVERPDRYVRRPVAPEVETTRDLRQLAQMSRTTPAMVGLAVISAASPRCAITSRAATAPARDPRSCRDRWRVRCRRSAPRVRRSPCAAVASSSRNSELPQSR